MSSLDVMLCFSRGVCTCHPSRSRPMSHLKHSQSVTLAALALIGLPLGFGLVLAAGVPGAPAQDPAGRGQAPAGRGLAATDGHNLTRPSLPNPYRTVENIVTMPAGRTWARPMPSMSTRRAISGSSSAAGRTRVPIPRLIRFCSSTRRGNSCAASAPANSSFRTASSSTPTTTCGLSTRAWSRT